MMLLQKIDHPAMTILPPIENLQQSTTVVMYMLHQGEASIVSSSIYICQRAMAGPVEIHHVKKRIRGYPRAGR